MNQFRRIGANDWINQGAVTNNPEADRLQSTRAEYDTNHSTGIYTGVATSDLLANVYAQATKIHDALVAAGVPEPGASYATYQSYHETGGWPSNYVLYWQHNNGSGIKYAGQRGTTRGAGGYAWFNTLQDWINAFAHEITKGSNPAGAQTIEDYAARLKSNGYYSDSLSNYLYGLKGGRLVLKSLPASERSGQDQATGTRQSAQDMDIPGSTKYNQEPGVIDYIAGQWKKLNTPEKIGVGILSIFTLKQIFK